MADLESNVVYGMYSGLALLMDVHRPQTPNGYGIIFINGSGWHLPLAYDALSLKEYPTTAQYVPPLTEAGYTVFAVNHRASPRFRYPAAVEDVQRAVRFIRHNAQGYGIQAERLGAMGGSSGAYLVSLLGVLGGEGDAQDTDPINRESARVQCVVARATPADMRQMTHDRFAMSFMGMLPREPDTTVEMQTYREGSAICHVSKESPPFLLMHGDADTTVPFEQSVAMEAALREAGATVRLLRIAGGGHGGDFPGAADPPDYLGEMVAWFDTYLRSKTLEHPAAF